LRARPLGAKLPPMMKISVLGLVGALVLSACGGGGSASCENAAACGGDVVGTWKITSSCVKYTGSAMTDFCPSATLGATSFNVTGSETFGADGTYTSAITVAGSVTVNVPASCLKFNGLTLTCDQITQVFAAMPQAGIKSFKCVGTSDCACTVSPDDAVSNGAGTYTTTGAGLLSLMPTNGATSDMTDYCVKGSTMTQSPRSGDITGTIVFTKQ
jgi:hypothetical protein